MIGNKTRPSSCTQGGLRGVIWADVFQGIIMFVGMLSVIIRSSILLGGFDKVSEIAMEGERSNLFK